MEALVEVLERLGKPAAQLLPLAVGEALPHDVTVPDLHAGTADGFPIPNRQGRMIELRHVAALENKQGLPGIDHYNGDRVITNGGIHGVVVGVGDDVIQVRIADKVRTPMTTG